MTLKSHSWTYIQRKSMIQKDAYIPMFIAALFTIAKTWKQPKCSLSEEQIKKIWDIYIQGNITQSLK